MKKIIFMGRVGSGKTTLTNKIKGCKDKYKKTQYIQYGDFVIDTPGEYAENRELGAALALYAYEADIVGLLISATDDYSIFPPNVTCMVNREVIGIVTQIDKQDANPERAASWLRLTGCKKIFYLSAKNGKGINELLEYLR